MKRPAVEPAESGGTASRTLPFCLLIILDAKHADRAIDVLDPAFALVLERQAGIAAQLIADAAGDVDLARFGQAFEAGGNVDAVAVDVAVVDDYVAGVDADAELDSAAGIDGGFAR